MNKDFEGQNREENSEDILENINEEISEEALSEEDGLNDSLERDEKVQTLENQYKRLQADFDNFRKRSIAEKAQLGTYVKSEVIESLLPILDNFERALTGTNEENNAYTEGFAMIYKNLKETLQGMGLKEIEALGKKFDPQYHQAVMNAPSDEYEDDHICQVLQKGYEIEGKVIRPAMVCVTNN